MALAHFTRIVHTVQIPKPPRGDENLQQLLVSHGVNTPSVQIPKPPRGDENGHLPRRGVGIGLRDESKSPNPREGTKTV